MSGWLRSPVSVPYIVVEDGDFNGRRELYLQHYHDGRDLDAPYAERTLQYVYQLWGRLVHLETRQGEKTVIMTCQADGVQRIEV
ncbi:MAG: hypothetical protein ACOY94_06370 [Bacillota bacterium]